MTQHTLEIQYVEEYDTHRMLLDGSVIWEGEYVHSVDAVLVLAEALGVEVLRTTVAT